MRTRPWACLEFRRREPARGLTEDPREGRAQRSARGEGRGPPAGAVLVERRGPWAAGTAERHSGAHAARVGGSVLGAGGCC